MLSIILGTHGLMLNYRVDTNPAEDTLVYPVLHAGPAFNIRYRSTAVMKMSLKTHKIVTLSIFRHWMGWMGAASWLAKIFMT